MKYQIQGKGSVDLGQNDFISEGGEGKVFSKGNTAYKIYTDLSKMIPLSKIKELSILDKDNIIRPIDLVLDKTNTIVGYTMSFVKGIPMCKLFTNDFRNRNNVTPENINKLIENMIQTIMFIHTKKCLIIDGNELNYLVDSKSYEIPYFIDVNAWQTPSFPATVIMPAVRDWHSKVFNELTDWFSFGIISFQLFIGIHPFKGRHPNYKPSDLIKRMQDNISVFNKDVSIPSAARDFSYIPSDFRDWYFKMFEKGERSLPPGTILNVGLLNIKQVAIKIVQSTNNFEISTIRDYPDDIVKFKSYGGFKALTTKKQIWIDNVDYNISGPDIDVVFTEKMLHPILVKSENDKLSLFNLNKRQIIDVNIKCQEKIIIDNTIFCKNESDLFELSLYELGDKIIPTVKHTWNIIPKSSQMFKGIIYQNVLGKSYVVIPKPKSVKNSSCQIIAIPELNGFRILDGKYENKVFMVIAEKGSLFMKAMFRFDDNGKYDYRKVPDSTIINFTVLDNGTCISINDDGEIEVFTNKAYSMNVTKINDPDIKQVMNLCHDGVSVTFFTDKKLYKITMKNK